MRTSGWWAATGLALILTLTACSGDAADEDSSSAAGISAAAPARAPDQASVGGAGPAQDTKAQAPDLSVDQRAIVYTGSITVRVDDVNAAAARVTGIVTGVGGFVGGDQRTSNGERGSADATLTLRVPAGKFTAVVDQLSGLGIEEQRQIGTEDVTEQTIDLDARIATQTARVASGRKLLGQAKDLDDLVMLEREVATREADLASLQAKKRRLADLTALSTITAVLLDPQAAGKPASSNAFADGWNGFVTSLGAVVTALGWVLPWLVLAAVPVGFWLLRRRRTLSRRTSEGAGGQGS
ncbi:DUF4349 domain-containing protein [Actinoplanes sp. N902-109]|uniref:DUF4349 domain-containing protein n=1 Tax=Actinoplanes sp. (strain N902-109) TaxID=649831 RepID=UPI0003296624|nr:DUF4349 domain-containing protein [Actinoplanes sp. N902-109]AGL21004.1 putative lipoprotein [Actinoplanes sp. N902-109]